MADNRAELIARAVALCECITPANGFINDVGGRVYVGDAVVNNDLPTDRAKYPFIAVQVDGSSINWPSHIQMDADLRLTIIGFGWQDPDGDVATDLWRDILRAVNPTTSSGKLTPESSVETPPERGQYAVTVSVDYTAEVTECYPIEPDWLIAK